MSMDIDELEKTKALLADLRPKVEGVSDEGAASEISRFDMQVAELTSAIASKQRAAAREQEERRLALCEADVTHLKAHLDEHVALMRESVEAAQRSAAALEAIAKALAPTHEESP